MNILHIEDEDSFVALVRTAVEASGNKLLTLDDVGIHRNVPIDGEGSLEEQLRAIFSEHDAKEKISLVLLDTDLIKYRNQISHSACRTALQTLGIPVCRYSKKQKDTTLSNARKLATIATEGSTSILVPRVVMSEDDATALAEWLTELGKSFDSLHASVSAIHAAGDEYQGPAGLLAHILDKPDARLDFFGYTAQNLFFFGRQLPDDSQAVDGEDRRSRRLSTQLGYWLHNYILAFPGPILHRMAVAASLNLRAEVFENTALGDMLSDALYKGPFAGLQPYYWGAGVYDITSELDAPLWQSPEYSAYALDSAASPDNFQGYFCVLTGKGISATQAAAAPDWIPSGARMTRVELEVYEQLSPLLSI